jgi:hypothetical protein
MEIGSRVRIECSSPWAQAHPLYLAFKLWYFAAFVSIDAFVDLFVHWVYYGVNLKSTFGVQATTNTWLSRINNIGAACRYVSLVYGFVTN